MTRLNFLLLIVLIGCALSLVTAQQRARKLFVDHEKAQQQARQLDIEWNQLKLEQGALIKHGLIDQIARRDLHMLPVTPARTHYLAPTAVIAPPNAAAAVSAAGEVR